MSGHRLPADAPRGFGGIELDRSKSLSFTLDGRRIAGFAGDTLLSAMLANSIDTLGRLGEAPIGLGERLLPPVATKDGRLLPLERTPLIEGLELTAQGRRAGPRFRQQSSLRLAVAQLKTVPMAATADVTLTADLVIVGGGVAGLAAAAAATKAGRSVVLVERRPWLGGDARYYGPVGEAASPEIVVDDLLKAIDGFTVLTRTEAFDIRGSTIVAHQVEAPAGELPRGRIVAVTGERLLLATGSNQRLPVFSGNRLPGVRSTIEAYHLAKRYGVSGGASAVVSTPSNYGYRLALRLHEAGVAIRRIVDTRVGAQSRFIDFAKASGLSLGSGQVPLSATLGRSGLSAAFVNEGSTRAAATLEATQLIVSGASQPELSLWMLAGGGASWSGGRLVATGHLPHVGLAGAVAGFATLEACRDSGRVAYDVLFGAEPTTVADTQIDPAFETPDAATPVAPRADGAAFLDAGTSLLLRPVAGARSLPTGHALSIGDVAAAVDLGLIAPGDAGAVAGERGAPGRDIVATAWRPAEPEAGAPSPYLEGRFGARPTRVHLIVDGRRVFEPGALVYANTGRGDPGNAVGVIVDAATPGGTALIDAAVLETMDRFVVAMTAGPSPARIKPS
ncbi:MAG: FAD-dependent oxidoreductase [Devosia sp.]